MNSRRRPASRSGFFTTGVTNAWRKTSGKWPAFSERLKSSTINGATRSTTCFRTFVGIGSAADDLSGSRRTALMTSSIDSGEKVVKDTPERTRLTVGGDASFVLERTLPTLSTKKRCRKVRQSPKFAVGSPFSATVALFCDSVDTGQGFRRL